MPNFSSAQKRTFYFLFILITLVPFHWRSIFMGPIAIHVWAASDWYALALGFLDNGMDFFHPQVNQLNLQFPGSMPINELSGITAVDFPLNPYIVAFVMKLLGTTSPMVYRGYTLLLSLMGLFFLFRAVELKTGKFWYAVFIVSFVRFQPAYAYYMDGFMPTQNALSIYFIGIYFFVKYYQFHKKRFLALSVSFLTLAGLMRMPFSIPLIAIMGTLVFYVIYYRKINGAAMIITALGLGCILAYYIYNRSLAATYGSVFLNELMPPRNMYDLFFYWMGGTAKNSVSILPVFYLFIILLLGYFGFRHFQVQGIEAEERPAMIYLGIHLIGVLGYSLLMARQLWAHDYYFNDFFIPFLIVALIWSLQFVPDANPKLTKVFILFFIAASFQSAYIWQKSAYNIGIAERPGSKSVFNFENAREFLQEQKVPQSAVMLIVGSYAPSVPGNALHRKCFNVREPKTDEIQQALKWPFDYIITQNEFYKEVLEAYPNFGNETEVIATNGQLTLRKLRTH